MEQWDKWDFPGTNECLSNTARFLFWQYGGNQVTLEECKKYCKEYLDLSSFPPGPACDGILVDELDPGKCWIMHPSFSTFWSIMSLEIGNCGYTTTSYCGWCNNTYQFKYWNLSERGGKNLIQIRL